MLLDSNIPDFPASHLSFRVGLSPLQDLISLLPTSSSIFKLQYGEKATQVQ